MQHISTKAAKQAAFSDMKKSNVRIYYLRKEKQIREVLTGSSEVHIELRDYEKLGL